MFIKNPIDAQLDAEILRVIDKMHENETNSDDYAESLDTLSKLHELRQKTRVSKEALLNIAANVLGIVLVIKAEHIGVITTKALSFVKKIV